MAARDIILRPIVTEKSMKNQEDDNKVTFEVAKDANKTAVKLAVEEIFNVKVDSINVVNQKPKTKRMGRYVGKTNHLKKAYVKLKDGYNIDILTDK